MPSRRCMTRGTGISAIKRARAGPVVHKNLVDKVCKKATRNPFQIIADLAKIMKVSSTSMKRALTAVGLRSMPPKVQHEIFPGQEGRLERVKKLLAWRKKNMDKITVWSDEKLFYAEIHVNKQNDLILVPLICADHSLRY